MTKKFMVTVPTADSSREEELQTFFKMRNNLENRNTYIGMLFNQKLTDWFVRQVENDFSTDIMEDLATTEERLQSANEKATEFFNENVTLTKGIAAMRETYQVEITALKVQLDNMSNQLDKAKKQSDENWKKVVEARGWTSDQIRKRIDARHKTRKAFERMRKFFHDRESKWEFMFSKIK